MGGYNFGLSGPFWNGRSMLGGPVGVGNVYFVNNRGGTLGAELQKRYGKGRQMDGSPVLHSTIAAAAAVCMSGRNDYIIVLPSGYGIATTIDLGSIECAHLIGTNASPQDVGSQGSAYIVQTAAYPTVTLGNWCEVSDLQLWNYSGEETIYSTLKQGINIHHNFIRLTAAAAIASGVYLAGAYGNNYNRVANNKFHHYAGSAGGYVILSDNGTGNDIVGNEIIIYGGCTYDYGIFNNSHGGQTNFNRISDCGGGGTITVGIQTRTTNASACIGNLVSLPTGTALAGGTANRTFTQNFDAQAGGATAIET